MEGQSHFRIFKLLRFIIVCNHKKPKNVKDICSNTYNVSTRRPSKFSAHRIYLLDHQVILGTLPFQPLWTTVQNLKALNSFICLCMCAHVCALACAHTHRHMFACVWKSQYGYQELLLSFHYKESVHPMFPCGKNSLNVPFLIEPFIIFSDKSK